MIMRHFTALLFLLLFHAIVSAQTDPKAKAILDKSAAKFKAYPAVEVDFNLSMENKAENISEKHKGKAYMKGNMYKVEVMDVISYYDGKNIYTYMPDVKEVNIKSPDAEQEELLNPVTLFDIHNKEFNQQLVNTANGVAHIELTPIDKKKNINKIGILIDPNTSMIQKVTLFGKDGNNIIVVINSIKQPSTIPSDSFFRFDTKQFPDVEVIDLR